MIGSKEREMVNLWRRNSAKLAQWVMRYESIKIVWHLYFAPFTLNTEAIEVFWVSSECITSSTSWPNDALLAVQERVWSKESIWLRKKSTVWGPFTSLRLRKSQTGLQTSCCDASWIHSGDSEQDIEAVSSCRVSWCWSWKIHIMKTSKRY